MKPEFQGKGLAEKIVRALLNSIVGKFSNAIAEVSKNNLASQTILRKLGFVGLDLQNQSRSAEKKQFNIDLSKFNDIDVKDRTIPALDLARANRKQKKNKYKEIGLSHSKL